MNTITTDALIGRLKEKGLKMTAQRLAVIQALVDNCHLHPGAALIYREARRKAGRISLSTVYATLKEFSEKGLIRSLEFDRMENRYEGNLSEHINLVCKGCAAIVDYHLPPTIEPKDIARQVGFVVTDARMEYHGYCRDCLKRQK